MEKVTVDVHLVEKEEDDNAEPDCKDEIRVKAMNDAELREQLCIYGVNPGPILPSTRAIYENRLLQLMKHSPKGAAGVNSDLESSENDEGKGKTTEVLETNNLKVTAECASGLDNKSPVDVTERQKKLLSPDVEHSLAKIVAELQEILPEGKMSLHRTQGLRRKSGSSPERNYKRKKSDAPPNQDFGYPDANSVGQSTRRKTVRESPPTVKQGTKAKTKVTPERPREELIPMRVKIAILAILIFLLFVYITMETNLGNPFSNFITGT